MLFLSRLKRSHLRPTSLLSLLCALLGAGLLSSCATQSNLSGTTSRPLNAVATIPQTPSQPTQLSEAPASAEATQQPAVTNPTAENDSSAIVGIPSPPTETPALPPHTAPAPVTTTPVTLSTVPRTPVSTTQPNQIMMVRTTAYSHLQADSLPYGRKSAAGNDLQYGSRYRSAAADWSKYPMGTRFKIEGMPYEYVIDDYGSALVGTETIDIYKPNLDGIGNWGVRNVPIQILEWGCYEKSRQILDSRKHVQHAHHVRKMLSEIEKKGRNGAIAMKRDTSA